MEILVKIQALINFFYKGNKYEFVYADREVNVTFTFYMLPGPKD